MTQLMTVHLLKEVLPRNLGQVATQEFADKINQLVLDPETLDEVRQNFLTYSKVLMDGKFKVEDYLNAVTFATHKFMDYSNREAYVRTFPDRFLALKARGATDKDISAYTSAYAKNKLVTTILEQALIPVHVLYQDAFHMAMRTQVQLMTDTTVLGRDRVAAANSVLLHTKAPEVKKIELDVGLKESAGLSELRDAMRGLAMSQVESIKSGHASPGQMAAQRLVLTEADKAGAIDV